MLKLRTGLIATHLYVVLLVLLHFRMIPSKKPKAATSDGDEI